MADIHAHPDRTYPQDERQVKALKTMKIIGAMAFIVGLILLAIYVTGWIALITEHSPAEAVRLALTLWPGNAVGFIVLVLAFVFGGGGILLLTSKK
jgi:hypothetical protein